MPILGERERSLGWDANMTEIARMDELKQELEELRALVNTLLTIIMVSSVSVSYTHLTLPTIAIV